MKVSLYLSGASADHVRVSYYAKLLLNTGNVRLSDRWWETADLWTGTDHMHGHDECGRIAVDHCEHIESAKVFWLLAPLNASRGAFFELGYAVQMSRMFPGSLHVVVSGPALDLSVFTRHPRVHWFHDDEQAFKAVSEKAQELRLRFATVGAVP